MGYKPDEDKLMRERVLEYLQYYDDVAARSHEIAKAIGSKSVDYTRRQCNDLHEKDLIEKHYGDRIIGHPMPDGELVVLPNNKGQLLALVEKYEAYLPFRRSEVGDLPAPNLRTLLESELAIGEPRQLKHRKVSFSYSGESAGSEGAEV